jgi:hypothetical protein
MIVFVFLSCALGTGRAHALNPQETAQLEEAFKAYQTGDFSKTRDILEALASENRGNGDLCYDLGNTYYRLGRMGRAVLWYERALRQRPFDNDLRDNLAMARAGLKGEEESALEKVFTWPRVLWLWESATTCFWMGTGLLIFLLIKKDRRTFPAGRVAAVLMAAWIVFVAWASLRAWEESKPWGIIVAPDIQIRSGPGTGFAVGATAPEGLKVLMLEGRDGWTLAGLPKAGIKGWTQSANVERIE